MKRTLSDRMDDWLREGSRLHAEIEGLEATAAGATHFKKELSEHESKEAELYDEINECERKIKALEEELEKAKKADRGA